MSVSLSRTLAAKTGSIDTFFQGLEWHYKLQHLFCGALYNNETVKNADLFYQLSLAYLKCTRVCNWSLVCFQSPRLKDCQNVLP